METISSTDGSFAPFQTLFHVRLGRWPDGTASIDMTPGLKSSTTHGAWTQIDGQRLSWTGHAYSFDDTGLPNGIYNIKEHFTLAPSGNTYGGTCTFEVVNGPGGFLPADAVRAHRRADQAVVDPDESRSRDSAESAFTSLNGGATRDY